jgi:adenylate cyclase
MDGIWQWVWDRYGARWSWVVYAISATLPLPIYLSWSFLIVAIEESSDYVEAAAVTVVGVPLLAYVNVLPGLGRIRLVERWAAALEVDRARALDATYAVTRVAVDEHLRVINVQGAFAAGDVAAAWMDDGHLSVMSCQHGTPKRR